MKNNENQLMKLSNNVLSHYDNTVGSIMKPTSYEPQVSEFDKLRKRVSYLTKGKNTPLNAAQEQVPWNMQIYQGFLDEDEKKKKAMRESRKLEGRAASENDTDSDESEGSNHLDGEGLTGKAMGGGGYASALAGRVVQFRPITVG